MPYIQIPKRYLFILILLSFSIGCGQLSSLQTAKVVGKNQATIGGAILGYGIQDDSFSGGDIGSGLFPHAEFLGRYGLSNTFDIGLKLSTGGNILLDGKYQFAGTADSQWAMAIGGGFEFQVSNFQENIVFRTHLPLYLSYHPNDKAAIYATPRYVFQSVSNDNNSYFLGASAGFNYRFSPKFSGLLEASWYRPSTQNTNNDGLSIYQFGLGGVYHFPK